jgi:GH25 family lysozyme M1 (1,4-beta-N-acetylmuramidase)
MIVSEHVRRAPMIIMVVAGAAALGLLPAVAQPAQATSPSRSASVASANAPAAVDPENTQMGWKNRQRDEASSSLRASVKVTGVLGLDVSSYQGTVNWKRWVARGRSFAYIKATQGTSYRNPLFAKQYNGAYAAGMTRGAYHFANPAGKSGVKQARYFVKHGGGWTADGRTLPGVLDIEYNPSGSTCYRISKKKMITWITDFTVEYKRLTTRDAVIYTTLDWWTRCTGNTTKFTQTNPLWAARWGTKDAGKLPGAWAVATFWQYASTSIDYNRFSSTPDRLKVLATGVEPAKK